jgi:hypothetical protein
MDDGDVRGAPPRIDLDRLGRRLDRAGREPGELIAEDGRIGGGQEAAMQRE